MAQPKTIERWSPEWNKLNTVARMLTALSAHDASYIVGDCYFDAGQDWMWTTILRRGWRACQVLCPRDWEDILLAPDKDALLEVVKTIRADKYFSDKEDYFIK